MAANQFGPVAAGTTVVFVHGMMTDSTFWHPLIDHLANLIDSETALLAYDLRGHGESSWPARSSETTLRTHADDLAAVVKAATGKVVLVAHSAGTIVAQELARHYPGLFRGLSAAVLFSPAAEVPEFPSAAPYLKKSLRLAKWRRTRLDSVAAFAHRLLEEQFGRTCRRYGAKSQLATNALRNDSRVLADLLTGLAGFHLAPEAVASLAAVPVAVVAAQRDVVVPPEQARRLAERIEADFEIALGAGHSLPRANTGWAASVVMNAIQRTRSVSVGV